MQHRYVPDLGDFSKFAVIDALSGQGEDHTALIWYLVDPDELKESHNNDGKHTTYLADDRQGLSQCHPDLYRRFQVIDATGEKHVGVYARKRVLPHVGYFAEPLSYEGRVVSERTPWREGWLARAMKRAENSSLVVLDPDNGLMPERISARAKQAIKYTTLDECAAFYGEGQRSLVVYQHAHRQGSAAEQATHAMARLCDRLGVSRDHAFALRFHRGTTRFYLVMPGSNQSHMLRQRADALVDSAWGERGHFSIVD